MKILVDVSLSPAWVAALAAQGLEAFHWSDVGNPRAPDSDILEWAAKNECVVLTHDLDLAGYSLRNNSTVQAWSSFAASR